MNFGSECLGSVQGRVRHGVVGKGKARFGQAWFGWVGHGEGRF